jgi:hypothetical protein
LVLCYFNILGWNFLYYISGGYKHTIPVLFALTCLGGNFNLGFTISPSEWFVLETLALIAIKSSKVEYQSNQNFSYLVYSYSMQGINFFLIIWCVYGIIHATYHILTAPEGIKT